MANFALVQLRWQRNRPTGQPPEDVMVNTLHFQCSTGGLVAGDADDFITHLALFVNATLNASISEDVFIAEARFYDMPAVAGPLGAPAFTRVDPLAHGGAGRAGTMPPQVALTVTLQVAARRHWGRIYVGGLTYVILDDGRANAAILPNLADDFRDFALAQIGSGQGLYVWNRATWAAQEVREISIDDVFDVQRRRRYDRAVTREQRNLFP